MEQYYPYAIAFISGLIVGVLIIVALAKRHWKRTKVEKPLTQQEKRLIRELAKEATGRDFLWTRDGTLALWE